MTPAVAVDWDGTLVHGDTWLPGAERALLGLRRSRYEIIVHTVRAGWPQGREQIAAKLDSLGFRENEVRIEAKPDALCYIDNRGYRFTGDWQDALRHLASLEAK
jgi:ribonucleotide monophosphatase NagD (HAD superfamily)